MPDTNRLGIIIVYTNRLGQHCFLYIPVSLRYWYIGWYIGAATRCPGWRIHGSVEDTKLSTNKNTHTLSLSLSLGDTNMRRHQKIRRTFWYKDKRRVILKGCFYDLLYSATRRRKTSTQSVRGPMWDCCTQMSTGRRKPQRFYSWL